MTLLSLLAILTLKKKVKLLIILRSKLMKTTNLVIISKFANFIQILLQVIQKRLINIARNRSQGVNAETSSQHER